MADHPELSPTLRHFNLTTEDADKPVSSKHIQEIARSCCCKWQYLPAVLEMKNPETVVYDIERGGKPEDEMRASFFSKWKSEKGSGATYRQLMNALLAINCKEDAEFVCELLVKAATKTSQGDGTTHGIVKQNLSCIKGRFASLVSEVSVKLSLMEINMQKFRLFISNLFSPGEFMSSENTIMGIFCAITNNKLWDYMNYSPVEEICKEFGENDEEISYCIRQYKEKLSGFKATTKIIDYINECNEEDEIADSEQSISQYKARYNKQYCRKLAIKLKDQVTEKSLEYVDQFWKSVADLFLLPSLPVLLESIHKGCTEITWFVSITAASKIECDAHRFHQLGNITVTLDDKIVFEAHESELTSKVNKEIEWDDDAKPLPPKLQYYGEKFYSRFIHPTKSTLLDVQKEALMELVKWFSNTHAIKDTKDKTAVVVMPTGTGKTGVICCLPYALMGNLPPGEINTRKSILIIAPGVDIQQQLMESLSSCDDQKSFLERRGLLQKQDIENQAHYSVYMVENTADVSNLEHRQSDIILSNAQKWRTNKDKDKDKVNYKRLPSNLFSMVIVDEAHHLPTEQWAKIVNKFRENAKIIFFTATPYRTDKKEITQDKTLSTKGKAYKLEREEAIAQNLIRKVQITELEYDGRPPRKKSRLTADTYISRKEEEAIERMQYAEIVLAEVKKCLTKKNGDHPLPGGKQHTAIIIAKTKIEAEAVELICIKQLGFDSSDVQVVHSSKFKTQVKRKEVIKMIKDGHFQVVIVIEMLLEGFDYPPFSIAGIVTNITSQRKFAQSVGRIQRVVRHTDSDGRSEIEIGGIGDIITHEHFNQRKLYNNEFVKQLITKQKNYKNCDESGYESGEDDTMKNWKPHGTPPYLIPINAQ